LASYNIFSKIIYSCDGNTITTLHTLSNLSCSLTVEIIFYKI
jgi:hypothetical protein